MSIEDIVAALASSHGADLVNIRQYIAWIQIRRHVHHRFYFQAHWVYAKKEPAQLEQALRSIFDTHAGNAHWV